MRKNRILAGLLIVIILASALPMSNIFAEVNGVNDADLMAAIAPVMEYTEAVPATNNANWVALNMDFANNFTQTPAMNVDAGVTYDADGINFPMGSTKTWKYTEQVSGQDYGGWSPLCLSFHYSFRFKLNEGGELRQTSPRIWGTDNRGVDITFTNTGVAFLSNGTVVPDSTGYAPGTEWNDVLIRNIHLTGNANTVNNGGYQVWMKKASDSSFSHIGNLAATSYTYTGASFSPGPAWATDGLTFEGNGAHVKHAVSAMEKPETVDPTPEPEPMPNPDPDPNPGSGTTMGEELVAASNRIVWLDDDFSTQKEGWSLLNGMEYDGENEILTTGSPAGIVEANYSLAEIPLGFDWTIRFKLRINEGHSGRIDGIFSDGADRFYWSLYPDKNQIGAQGPGTASVVNEKDTWYEYIYQFREIDGKKGVSAFYRQDETSAWTAIYGNYKYDTVNVSTSAPAARFLCHDANTNFSLDDVRIYQGAYVKLDAPIIDGEAVKVSGLFDNGEPRADQNRQITLLAAIYDKEKGYTVGVEKTSVVASAGTVKPLDYTFQFEGLDPSKHSVVVMAWDAVENGLPLVAAVGGMKGTADNLVPELNQEVGIVSDVSYNNVLLMGFLGEKRARITASLEKDGVVYAVIQETANQAGMIDTSIGIDPDSSSGEYTLRIQYGNATATETLVKLSCNDSIPTDGIDDKETLERYINVYGDAFTKEILETEGILPYVYKHFSSLASNDTYHDIYNFSSTLKDAAKMANDEVAMLVKLNQSVASKNWADSAELLVETYGDFLGITEDALNGIYDYKGLFLRLVGNYTSAEEVNNDFMAAVNAQKAAEKVSSGGFVGDSVGGGGGFSGGGGSGGSFASGQQDYNIESDLIPEEIQTDIKEVYPQFNDLETVPWATDSIRELQILDIISGDEEGKFVPDRAVSREEFLKLIMLSGGIEVIDAASVQFEDVVADAWYTPYVATAYELGIVKGISESEFGVGAQITRADMAVMLKRVLDYCGVEIVPVKASFRFADCLEIPDYAMDDVAILSEAELLNGMGDNTFLPMASASRAEAAVAVCRIYHYIGERR